MSTRPSASAQSTPLWGAEARAVFLVALALYGLLGWLGVYLLDTYNVGDGVSRISQAYGVLFSRDPHLAALGFIWPPLPGLTDLPLVLLLKPLGRVLFAGPLMSAFYSALALAQLYDILRRFGLPAIWRAIWLIGFGLHNIIVHDATMGLSEAPFLALLLVSLNGFLIWDRERKTSGVMISSLGAALAFLCRYEALAWTAGMAVAIIWRQWLISKKFLDSVAIGSFLAFIAPTVWLVGVWVLLNWQITGNPINFLVGPGSTATTPDTAHLVGPSHPFYYAQKSLVGSMMLIWRQASDLAPLLVPGSALLAMLAVWRRRWMDLVYLPLGWSIVVFTFLIAWRGILPHFTRFFFWMVPAGVIMAAAAHSLARGKWQGHLVAGGAALLLFLPSVWLPMRNWPKIHLSLPEHLLASLMMAPEVQDYGSASGVMGEFKGIAEYLDAQPRGTLTMVDATVGFPVPLFRKRPQDLVTTTDTDFFPIVRAPVGRVQQVLVPKPTFDARGRSEILKFYPDIYDGKEAWARLEKEFPGPGAWRLFQVAAPPASP